MLARIALNRQFGCERSLDAGNGEGADGVKKDLRFCGVRVLPHLRVCIFSNRY